MGPVLQLQAVCLRGRDRQDRAVPLLPGGEPVTLQAGDTCPWCKQAGYGYICYGGKFCAILFDNGKCEKDRQEMAMERSERRCIG